MRNRYIECARELLDGDDRSDHAAPLDLADIGEVQARVFGELFLRLLACLAQGPHGASERAHQRRHDSTAAAGVVSALLERAWVTWRPGSGSLRRLSRHCRRTACNDGTISSTSNTDMSGHSLWPD